MPRMIRVLCAALTGVLLVWSVLLLDRRALQVPAVIGTLFDPVPSLSQQRNEDLLLRPLLRFMDHVRPEIPERARVVFMGPLHRGWPGIREEQEQATG